MLRRQKLGAALLPNSLMIVPGASLQYRSRDVTYPFRQDSNFYYLTGWMEPDAVLLLIKNDQSRVRSILFIEVRDKAQAIWIGETLNLEETVQICGHDEAHDILELEKYLSKYLSAPETIYYAFALDLSRDQKILQWVKQYGARHKCGSIAKTWVDYLPILYEMRLKKDLFEIELLSQAANIAASAHIAVMKNCRPGKKEYELEGVFLQACYQQGATQMAYLPIVAAGNNACVLHYHQNTDTLRSGELLLVDAGCEYQYYASDITRTIPINGKFSAAQKRIYQIVLAAQLAAIEKVRPGMTWDCIQEEIIQIIVEGLVKVKILQGPVSKLIAEHCYKPFYMHSSGHWLGLDVHDVGEYYVDKKPQVFKPGMVLTIEPGIYIRRGMPEVDKKWWGIGIRIEDDVLVTEQGCEVLSRMVPKTVEHIESLMLESF